jgi:hypothetical protein
MAQGQLAGLVLRGVSTDAQNQSVERLRGDIARLEQEAKDAAAAAYDAYNVGHGQRPAPNAGELLAAAAEAARRLAAAKGG